MNKRIMIVDDDPGMVRLVSLGLKRHGYEVVGAKSGADALTKASEVDPALFVLDVMMPDMDGFELCEHLRMRTDTCDTPVVFLSAHADNGARNRGREVGADAFLSKTDFPTRLVKTINQLLGVSVSKAS